MLLKAISEALAERKGINRFACTYAPMDETLTRAVITFQEGLIWSGKFFTKLNWVIWI